MPETIRAQSTARRIAVVGDIYSLLLTGEDTGGAACLIDATIPPGGGPAPHLHTREDEIFYILEGEVTFDIAGKTTVVRPGTSIYAPRNQRHRFHNASTKPARMLMTITPAGLEQMFLEVAQPVPAGATTVPPPTPDQIAAVMSAAPRYGITLFPPGS
jgi:quercetin dioxygenase-like cupin family protein